MGQEYDQKERKTPKHVRLYVGFVPSQNLVVTVIRALVLYEPATGNRLTARPRPCLPGK
jgi:hypothetical protein